MQHVAVIKKSSATAGFLAPSKLMPWSGETKKWKEQQQLKDHEKQFLLDLTPVHDDDDDDDDDDSAGGGVVKLFRSLRLLVILTHNIFLFTEGYKLVSRESINR